MCILSLIPASTQRMSGVSLTHSQHDNHSIPQTWPGAPGYEVPAIQEPLFLKGAETQLPTFT